MSLNLFPVLGINLLWACAHAEVEDFAKSREGALELALMETM